MSLPLTPATRADEPEKQLWKGGYSPLAMIGGWILSLIVTVVACGVALFVPLGGVEWLMAITISAAMWGGHLVYLIYQRLGIEYELSTQRFIHRHGVLTRVTDRIEVIDIDDVQVRQTFVERMFGVGTIRLLSSDLTNPALEMSGIDNVTKISTLIDDTRRAERRKRSVHIETV